MKLTLTRAGALGAAILSILAVAAGSAHAATTVTEAAALNHLKAKRQNLGLTGSDIGEVLVIGKTSLANLIPRLYDPTAGRVTINGRDLRDYPSAAFRDRMALVMQDPFLFSGSIRDNIIQGISGLPSDQAAAIMAASNLERLIARLPDGLDTVLGEGGGSISTGERQLIAIARAFARNPELILFDEATSAIDSHTERWIQEALERLMRRRTALVIAHRLSTVRHADRILVLNRGRIVESGTEAFIEKTIGSVITQTILPEKWVIVSDGSTDRTDDIVKGYALERPWMKLIRRAEATDRNFASKVFCFNAGYEQVKDTRYDIIGNLDADLSFDKDYFEYLLDQFARNPELGVAGTLFVEEASTHYDYRFANIDHVFGGCQMFRRQCFEAIGGYLPIKGGGIDWVAVTTARMKGWKTRTFTDKTAFHHRRMGTGKGGVLSAKFRLGREDYSLGSHPLWALIESVLPDARTPKSRSTISSSPTRTSARS